LTELKENLKSQSSESKKQELLLGIEEEGWDSLFRGPPKGQNVFNTFPKNSLPRRRYQINQA
jgi:hypothetical protein